MTAKEIPSEEVDRTYQKLKKEAESGGYNLNPDEEFTKDLVRGLLTNQVRYGYWACPCRLGAGDRKDDLDIICPCDYRDQDLEEYDACYCGLYVSRDVREGKKTATSIPERRPPMEERKKIQSEPVTRSVSALSYPVWRCKVCGYLCARQEPPGICPICKVTKDRFERFM